MNVERPSVRAAIDAAMRRYGMPLTLDDTFPLTDRTETAALDMMFNIAWTGVESYVPEDVDADRVSEFAAERVAAAMAVLNYGLDFPINPYERSELDRISYPER